MEKNLLLSEFESFENISYGSGGERIRSTMEIIS